MDEHRDLIKKMLTVIGAEFPNEKQTKQEMELRGKMWLEILKVFPTEIISAAFKQVMSESQFAPHVGDIVAKIREIKEAQMKQPNELWCELQEAFRKADGAIYRLRNDTDKTPAREELNKLFDGLSAELQMYCITMPNFIKMSGEDMSYEKGRFLKAVPDIRKRLAMIEEFQLGATDEVRRLQG